MQKLEKILEEIELEKKRASLSPNCSNEHAVTEIILLEKIEKIIRKYMNDGWIPVEDFGFPSSSEHDFRFWITIQYESGFRRTLKATWNYFDKCFMHQNGKKILQDVIAYKYYSAPDPYRPERSNEHDGE